MSSKKVKVKVKVSADDVALDALWSRFVASFESKYLPLIGGGVNTLLENIALNGFEGCPNLLFYSNGFPLELLWLRLLRRVFGHFSPPLSKIWNKDVVFKESQYHFEIDMAIPSQCHSLSKLTEFIKVISSHRSIDNKKHIIVISNIEYILKSDKEASQTFRVLLERYSNNVMFICTTHKLSCLEKPLISRMTLIRVPMFAHDVINRILCDLDLPLPLPLPPHSPSNERNLAYAIYTSYLVKNGRTTNTLINLKYPFLHEFYSGKAAKPTIEQIRAMSEKLHGYDATIANITQDITILCKANIRADVVAIGAKVDHLIARTDGNRKPLYIEYFLNAVNELRK